MDIQTKELEYLLNNFWCFKDQNPEMYYNIKNNLDYYKDFIHNKLGSKLIVTDRIIKLEKIPSVPKAYMGITDFTNPLEYVIMFLVLLFLEDKPRLDQFILSDLVEFVSNMATTLKLNTIPDWNLYHHRKYMVNVINHLKNLGIIKMVEEISSFSEDVKAEGLYETTGISNFYIREFKNDIMNYNCLEDFQNDEFSETFDLADIRRYKIYRHLLYEIATYTVDLSEAERDYLKKQRGNISNELQKYVAADLELTKNMALLMYSEETKEKFDFPNSKAITDIVLLVNAKILNLVYDEKITPDKEEVINISKEELQRLIKETKEENQMYFSKYYRELTLDNFIKEIIAYMQEYDFVQEDTLGYKIYPGFAKIIGYIPKDDKEQLTLFGGENE